MTSDRPAARSDWGTEHERILAMLAELRQAIDAGSAERLATLWPATERCLSSHLALEEKAFERLEQSHAPIIRRARYEHDRMRELLAELANPKVGAPLQRQRIHELETALMLHSRWEREHVYPLFVARGGPAPASN